jgi:glycine dehydrogenase subunit 2
MSDTSSGMIQAKPALRRFHQAKWDEPVICELSNPGERGILVPRFDPGAAAAAGGARALIPESMRRISRLRLPEISQARVLRHYARLSQENLGADFNIDVGQGTCTMKYNPKVNDQLARLPQVSELHPLQDEETVQGMLEILYRFEQMLKEISGLDRFTLQPCSGSSAIFTNACIMRAWHRSRGEGGRRDEIITSIFSHPSDAACAKVAGYKVITLYPGPDGYPTVEALKAAISERTAGLIITNPEDTGIYNPHIDEFTSLIHAAGGLCCYDQANANGILGIARAREAGFDLCQFNLHKTFSTPHGCGGPAVGAAGVTSELAPFLPVPTVEYDGSRYYLDWNRPNSIGKVAPFYGVASVVVRAYAWIMNLGAEGLKRVAETAVLNNNYLMKKVLEIPGASVPWPHRRRIEQVRYSWESLAKETGVHSEEIGIRAADYGVHYWTSHHPYVVPEPFTLEPTESYSLAELDEYAGILKHVAEEAVSDPEHVKNAPYASTVHKIEHAPLDDPRRWAITWRAFLRKHGAPAAHCPSNA